MQIRKGKLKLLRVIKRILKQILAVLSLLFPKLLTIRKSPRQVDAVTSEQEFMYTSLFELRRSKTFAEDGKAKGGTSNESDEAVACDAENESLAELVVTLDPLTTGFMQDFQLIIQLAVDKGSLKLKTTLTSVRDFVSQTITIDNLREFCANKMNTQYLYHTASMLVETV